MYIIERTPNDSEKEQITATVDSLEAQLRQLRSWMEQTRQAVGDSLDSWHRFMTLYQTIMQWVEEKKEFLATPLQLTSLAEARAKSNEYSVSACHKYTRQLMELQIAIQ